LRRVFFLGLFAAATGLPACSCPQSNILIDDFESCSGTCGWTISGSGTASIVSTILPGEHGLRMPGGVTATKSIPPATVDNTYSLELVGDCADGIAATLTATVPKAPDITLKVTLAIDNSLTTSGNPPNYTGASYVPLVGGLTLPSGVTTAAVHQVTLSPAAGAACTVDLVRLTAATPCNQ
jgi:hypothetical protein